MKGWYGGKSSFVGLIDATGERYFYPTSNCHPLRMSHEVETLRKILKRGKGGVRVLHRNIQFWEVERERVLHEVRVTSEHINTNESLRFVIKISFCLCLIYLVDVLGGWIPVNTCQVGGEDPVSVLLRLVWRFTHWRVLFGSLLLYVLDVGWRGEGA